MRMLQSPSANTAHKKYMYVAFHCWISMISAVEQYINVFVVHNSASLFIVIVGPTKHAKHEYVHSLVNLNLMSYVSYYKHVESECGEFGQAISHFSK